MQLVVVPHDHDAAAVERRAQLFKRVLDLVALAGGGVLQLTQLERTVGAEEDRLDGRRQIACHAGLASMWIGPKRSFWRTVIKARRSSSRTATNVITASSLSSDSRMNWSSSRGPRWTRLVISSSFSSSVHVLPSTTTGRGGMRASTLLKAATSTSISSGSSWPAASVGRAGGGKAKVSCSARSIRSWAIAL